MTREDICKAIFEIGGNYVSEVGIAEHHRAEMSRFRAWLIRVLKLTPFLWPAPRVEIIIMGRPGLDHPDRIADIIRALYNMRACGVVFQVRAFVNSNEILFG